MLQAASNRFKRRISKNAQNKAERQDKFVCQCENARQQVERSVRYTLEIFRYEILSSPVDSPDVDPSDPHLFLFMQCTLSE